MFINALNDLHIANKPRNMLNFGMEHVVVCVVCRTNLNDDGWISVRFAFKPDLFPLEITILPWRWTGF